MPKQVVLAFVITYCSQFATFALNFILLLLTLQGSRDNMSVVLVAFAGAPKVSEEAIEKVKCKLVYCFSGILFSK